MAAAEPLSDGPYFVLVFPLRFLRVIVLLSLWRMLLGSRGVISGLSAAQLITYTLIAEVFADVLYSRTGIDDSFWDGSIITRFLRPVSIFSQFMAEMAGTWIPAIVLFSLPLLLLAPLMGVDPRPSSALHGLLFAVSLCLAVSVGAALDFLLATMGVALQFNPWILTQIRGAVVALLSGAVIPLALFPFGLARALQWLPFASMASAPLQIYVGAGSTVRLLALQIAWSVILWPLAGSAMRSVREKMVSYGG